MEKGRTYVEGLLDQPWKLECIGFASRRQVGVATDLTMDVPLRLAVLTWLAKIGSEMSWDVRVITRSIVA